jgi:[amino group carrier protein]-lysine/ornithine hydrolase
MTISDTEAVKVLAEAVRTPSLCGQEDAVAAVLLEAMRRAGFSARRDETGNVIGAVGPGGGRQVVILGHMDTVPGYIEVEERDGSLYGRGSVDAKGPLVTGLVAAARAAERTRVRVTVIGAVQEEGPSVGARHLTSRPAPDFLVIAEPGGWDSVVLGYKGSQRFTMEIRRPSGHTAGPLASAPERAVQFWNDLTAWCAAQTPEAQDEFSRLTPALIRMSSSDDGLEDRAGLHIGLRLPPGVTPEDVREGVRSLCPDACFDFAPGEPAVRGGKNNELVAGFLRAIRSEGGKPRFKVKTGTADMNVVGPVWGCPMVAYGPGDSKLDHTPHEHVVIDEYLRAIRVLQDVLESLT